ncbi:hypothetical protein FVE85_4155 [Porphyridium purpureum]|uniref:Uncharacterized protein n=1 Tax=Porphyridium purpureum TaxID=35688 RepID=A0A5J4YTC6_PORPP|nr:hypothetical protein FVE85_4155 [Porphyridium purpureum]|eukprot:POR5676..scf229_5
MDGGVEDRLSRLEAALANATALIAGGIPPNASATQGEGTGSAAGAVAEERAARIKALEEENNRLKYRIAHLLRALEAAEQKTSST